MTEPINLSEYDHPAMMGVDHDHIRSVARLAAGALLNTGHAVATIEPGDATRYLVVIVRTKHPNGTYLVGSNHAPVYAWRGLPTTHPDYATEHYANRRSWTGVVMALFLNAVAEAMQNASTS